MKIALYTPYLDSFGGGERYILTIAETLLPSHQVEILLDKHLQSLNPDRLIADLSTRLNLNLANLKLVPAPIGKESNFFKRTLFLRKYDAIFYLTDGSFFYSTAKKNIIHFQVPFQNLTPKNIWQNIKVKSWNLAIYNSQFTRSYVDPQLQIKERVVYPPVDVEAIKLLEKKNQILSVGRFASFSKSKKHEEMIQSFKDLFDKGQVKGWSLYLAGSVEGDQKYLDKLKVIAGSAPVCFYPNLAFDKLVKLYGESSIYWHAAGFGEDDPAKMEHFGISTVEAMAGGCVPVVVNLGGQKEIVEDTKSGFLWDTLDELKEKTLKVINNRKLMTEISQNACIRSNVFSKKKFADDINLIIS